MLRLEDALDDFRELEAMARADAEAEYGSQSPRYTSQLYFTARALVEGLSERLPLTERTLPWWLGLVEVSATEAARDLGIPRRALTANAAALSEPQLREAAELVGSALRRRHGAALRRFIGSLDYETPAALTNTDSAVLVEQGWRAICRVVAWHDQALALLSGPLPYLATPSEPAPVAAEPAEEPAEDAPQGIAPLRPPRSRLRCPQCGTTWQPRRPQPVKCPRCQYRFGWGL